jgi:O-antigen ligase
MLFVACVPMAAYLGSRGGLMGLRRLFWTIALGVLVSGVYLTDSRGALLALLAVMGVFIWQRRGLMTAGALGAMAVGVLLALPSRFSEIDPEEESAQGRVESWFEGLQMFREHPLFGVGPDQYTDYNPLTAHNSFVLVLAETGIIGFTIWLAFVIYGFRMMWQGSRPLGELTWESDAAPAADGDAESALAELDAIQADMAERRPISMALLLSLVGFFTASFFLSRSYVIVLYLLSALVVAQYTDQRRGDPGLPVFVLGDDLLLWPVVGLCSAIGLYIVVKIRLVMQ